MTGIEWLAGPWRWAPAQASGLIAGAVLFGVGRLLRPRIAQRLWLGCGLAYLAAAIAFGLKSPPNDDAGAQPPPRATAGLEAALGMSFVGAGFASERLDRMRKGGR